MQTDKAVQASQNTYNGSKTKVTENRNTQRKRKTRSKLMRAAMHLMAESGVKGVTINQITEAADVGFGSFYNHFASLQAIYDALFDEMFESHGAAIQCITEAMTDPAERMSAGIRYALNRSDSDPAWGRFLLRTGFTVQLLEHGLGQHMLRDLNFGVTKGRFSIHDPLIALVMCGGAVLAAVSTILDIAVLNAPDKNEAQRLDFETEQIPERTSASILRCLGIPANEAEQIAHRPLPDVKVLDELIATGSITSIMQE